MKKQWKRLAALFVGSSHGGGNAAVLPDRYPAKYLVGDHGECGGNRCSDMENNRR